MSPTACPQCGAPGAFTTRRRRGEVGVEDYVACSSCPYEQVIRSGPREVVDLELDVAKLRGLVEAGAELLRPILVVRERRLEQVRAQADTPPG